MNPSSDIRPVLLATGWAELAPDARRVSESRHQEPRTLDNDLGDSWDFNAAPLRPQSTETGVPTVLAFSLCMDPGEGENGPGRRTRWQKKINLPYALKKGDKLQEYALYSDSTVGLHRARLVVEAVSFILYKDEIDADLNDKHVRAGHRQAYDAVVESLSRSGWVPHPFFDAEEDAAVAAFLKRDKAGKIALLAS